MTSAAAGLGLAGFSDALGLGDAQHMVITLIDGLGWLALREHADEAPTLSRSGGSAISTVFPSTTASALGSFGTGLLPGAHGLVGASFYLPETGARLSPLKWKGEPHPVMVQPEPTVFEQLERKGVSVSTVAPAAYENSGLTRAALRGGRYQPAETVAERVAALSSSIGGSSRSLTYVYWPELDRIGHEFGVGSSDWIDALRRVDGLIGGLAQCLTPNATMVVTADHGMVNCREADRICIDSTPELIADVGMIAGEPRARHIYVSSGSTHQVISRWQGFLGDRAHVRTREQIIDEDWFGPTDSELASRIGDVVCIGLGRTMLTSATDRRVSRLLGQHGAVTPEEWQVPALIFRA